MALVGIFKGGTKTLMNPIFHQKKVDLHFTSGGKSVKELYHYRSIGSIIIRVYIIKIMCFFIKFCSSQGFN